MAIISFTNYKRGQTTGCMGAVMRYTMQDKKTEFDGQRLVTGIWRQVFWVVIFRSEQSATGMTIQSRRSIGIHPITKRNVVWSCVGR